MTTLIFESVFIMLASYSIVGIGGVALLGKVGKVAKEKGD